MNFRLRSLTRYIYALIALVFIGLFSLLPFLSQTVYAGGSGGLLEPRSITMSSAVPSATGVTYQLKFTPVTSESGTNGELIVDFCGDTPIIGATCAFSNATTPVFGTSSCTVTASAGSVSCPGSNYHTIRVTGLTFAATTPYTITFGSITNPTTVTSFYARILTYGSGGSSGYTPASSSGGATTTGSYVDWGGAALSTVQTLSLTATVMETLTFCDSGGTITNCGTTSTPSLILGRGTPQTISASNVDGGLLYTQISTNALNGVGVALKVTSSTTCSGLSMNGGSTCGIPAKTVGASAPTAGAITSGTAAIGMCVEAGSGITAQVPYNGSCSGVSGNYNVTGAGSTTDTFGLNDSTSGTSTSFGSTWIGTWGTWANDTPFYTYGSLIFTSSAPLNSINDPLEFATTAANTTPAGIYTANYTLIATGSF